MRIVFLVFFNLLLTANRMFCWKFLKENFCVIKKDDNKELDISLHNGIKKINYDSLINIDYNNTTRFVPPISYGKVIKVYDGDTITIASRIPNTELPIYRFSVRLAGIDSPEIKGQTETEKTLAKESRDALNALIFGKIVHLQNINTEKYGRILADVYLENLHINQWMLDNNFAIPYDGGKKTHPASWDD